MPGPHTPRACVRIGAILDASICDERVSVDLPDDCFQDRSVRLRHARMRTADDVTAAL